MTKFLSFIKKIFVKYREQIMYIIFGVLTTIVSFGTQFISRALFPVSAGVGSIISWICSVTFAFFTNRMWVFKSPTYTAQEFFWQIAKFYGARIFSGLVEFVIMTIFVDMLFFNEFWIKVAANVIVFILNYIFSKFLVFKNHHETKETGS